MDPGDILATSGLLAVFVILLLKETGVPIPVPGDLIMLLAGIRAAEGRLDLWQVLLAILAAGLIGASIQFGLVRGPGRSFVYRFGRYAGLPPQRLDRAAGTLQARGARSVAVARITPGFRAAVPIAAGLAGLPYRTFIAGLIGGSLIWVLFHTLLGFFAGPIVLTMLQNVRLPILPLIAGLLLIGLAVWLFFGYRRSRGATTAVERVRAWTEAGCPACVLIGAIVPEENQLQGARLGVQHG
jgi:membrane-associated protein